MHSTPRNRRLRARAAGSVPVGHGRSASLNAGFLPFWGQEVQILKCEIDFLDFLTYSDSRYASKGDLMAQWHELTDLTGDRPFVVTGVRLQGSDISISGEFELPPLAGLRYEDQVFVSEFVRCHGSIKYMEKAFGVSYPTVKNRLNRIVKQLQLVEVVQISGRDEIFDLLERGEISVAEAAERLER